MAGINEKAFEGFPYKLDYKDSLAAKSLCYDYNMLHPSEFDERKNIIRKLFAKTGKSFLIVQPFMCDLGFNIEIGDHFFANNNCTILDVGKVTFGNNVYIGPYCGFYTINHALHHKDRNKGVDFADPITIGNSVWIGGGSVVLAGVTIGDCSVIGAGSVVTKNIPSGVVAAGNPCKVLRAITEQDLCRNKNIPYQEKEPQN